jgi:hypothetical protein
MRIRPVIVFLAAAWSLPLTAGNWYVRTDGGDRSQCTGRVDAPYSGSGANQPCAFKHFFYLFTTDPPQRLAQEQPRWIIAGGDTVIFSNEEHRMGYKTNDLAGYWNFVGCRGGAFTCYNPPLPEGTQDNPTRLVGKDWETGCQVKPKLMGGIGTGAVIFLGGAKHALLDCLEISDYAQCTTAFGETCVRSGFPKSDYATRGIQTDLKTDNVLIRNVWIHGLAGNGVQGPVGGTIYAENVRISGIAGGGWNTDDGTRSYSYGTLAFYNVTIEWCGCVEEYPITSSMPYYKCYDQTHGGYGDGLAILAGEGMRVFIDRSTIRYNVQDGADLLYVKDEEHSVQVTRSNAYGNGGQQWKFGPFKYIDFTNNLTVANCRRAAEGFAGAPATYNENYTDYCRAFDGVAVMVKGNANINWSNNTAVGYTSTVFDVLCEYIVEQFDARGRSGAGEAVAGAGTDGVRTVFELSYVPALMDITELRVNGARQTVGRRSDGVRQWYWDPATKLLSQGAGALPLTPTDTLTVRYIGVGRCDNSVFSYYNNIFRGYPRLDTNRTPNLFLLTGFNPNTAFKLSNNMTCGTTRPGLLTDTDTYVAACPGNWLMNEPVVARETDLDMVDLRLRPGSPAIDKGMALVGIQSDFDGRSRPFGVAYDVGAFEAEAESLPASSVSPTRGRLPNRRGGP